MKAPLSQQDIITIMKWRLIKLTGWTVEYVDSLPIAKLYEFHQIEDGFNKAKG